MRKKIIQDQTKNSGWINPLSEEAIKEFFENDNKSSEQRLSKILDLKNAAKIFVKEIAIFEKEFGLESIIATNKNTIPVFEDDIHFKYIRSVHDFKIRLDEGDNIVAVFIKEEDKVIAFGIANKENYQTELEVIEVEINSSRRAGLSREIEIENQLFEIGVGHLVVLKLSNSCGAPIWTDATSEESRYIFKSLGFVQDKSTSNPCILRKDE